jgi:hypothetical protein
MDGLANGSETEKNRNSSPSGLNDLSDPLRCDIRPPDLRAEIASRGKYAASVREVYLSTFTCCVPFNSGRHVRAPESE